MVMLKVINYNTDPTFDVYNAIYPQLIKRIATVVALRAEEPSYNGQIIKLLGHTTAGIGGGDFRADLSDTTTADDDGITIVTSGGKRWKRILGGFIDSDMYNGNAEKVIEGATTKNAIKLLSDYSVTSTIIMRSNTTLDCNGYKLSPTTSIGALSAQGSEGAYTNLSANMAKFSNTLQTTLSLAVGDWVFVRSEALYDDPIEGTVEDPSPVSKYGQIFRITSNPSTNTYRTDKVAEWDFNTSDTAQVCKLTVIENLIVKNLKINDINYTTAFNIGFNVRYAVNVQIDSPIFYGSKTKYASDIAGRSALKIGHCVDVVVNNPKFYHCGWYGVELFGANRNVVVNNPYGHDVRHLFSFNWLNGYGKNIDCHINGGSGDLNTLSVGDTHPNSTHNCTINDFIAIGSISDSGIQIRSSGVIVNGGMGIDNALDGLVVRNIDIPPIINNFIARSNGRYGVSSPKCGIRGGGNVAEDNVNAGFELSSGTVRGGSSERNPYAVRAVNSASDPNRLILDGLYAPQSSGLQTIGILFATGYVASKCILNNNHLVGYGDFVYSAPSGLGNNYIPTSNKNNQTHNHDTGSEVKGRHTFGGAGTQTITTTAFRSLVTPTGTRGGGQIANVILTKLSSASGITVDWRRVSSTSFEIIASGACEVEWAITGI